MYTIRSVVELRLIRSQLDGPFFRLSFVHLTLPFDFFGLSTDVSEFLLFDGSRLASVTTRCSRRGVFELLSIIGVFNHKTIGFFS